MHYFFVAVNGLNVSTQCLQLNSMSSTSQNIWNIIYCPNNIVKTCNILLAVKIISVSRLELYFTDLFLLECILMFKY